MSIELAEQLKRDLTDKYVMVEKGVPELRRFMGLTGRVKTVNMNGQVLVQFDHPVDIGWYDIHPTYLKVVDAPVKKEPAPHAEEKKANPAPATAPAKPVAPAAPAAAGGKKLSPLELARQQAAAKAAGGAAPAPAPAAPAGKKLSPLELARQQGAKKAAEAAAATEATAAPAPAAPEAPAAAPAAEAPAKQAAPAGKKLSPLEMARLQGALKKKPE
ncbi:MAG: hypothetical protein IT428_02810 [Planctomycetaceae bacterium]|nr:hypothetical protein [Planctomycetaceae bacterium]